MLYDIKLYTYANITSADKYDEMIKSIQGRAKFLVAKHVLMTQLDAMSKGAVGQQQGGNVTCHDPYSSEAGLKWAYADRKNSSELVFISEIKNNGAPLSFARLFSTRRPIER